jgi:hypothetical protein
MSFHNHSTEGGRPYYMRTGNYWQLFGHMYKNATPKFLKRMERLKREDEKSIKNKSVSSHYPNERK